MLLYITAEDMLGDASPERRRPRPLHTVPATLSSLYDMGMRNHVRNAAMLWPRDSGFEAVVDWKLDRLVIRLALYARERLGLDPGGSLAVVGGMGWLWPVVDFAAMGFGAASVGIGPDVPDDALGAALADAAPSAAFATDAAAAARLLALRRAGRFAGTVVTPDGVRADEEGVLPLARLLDLAATLDTAERAQAFRLVSRAVAADAAALWHVGAQGVTRLTHREAMELVATRLHERPAQPGDLAYVEARTSLDARLALASFVGDGLTTSAIGGEGRASADVVALRPHKLLVGRAWLEAACAGTGPRWPAGLDRRRARRRVHERLGDRVRWVEPLGGSGAAIERALEAARVAVVREAGNGRAADDGSG
jgi:hypothetical protein